MKLRLIVVGGVHEGKSIPINLPQFVIGRDPQCQLRPASAAISKRHCAIMVRGSQVFVADFGSTNGTFVNDVLVQGEVELHDGNKLKVGPLEFTVGLEVATTPKAAAGHPLAGRPTEAKAEAKGGVESVDMSGPPSEGPTSANIADLLLDDGGAPAASALDTAESVPDGSTVMELPATGKPGEPGAKKPVKTVLGTGNTSSAAAEILRKYQRRPRG